MVIALVTAVGGSGATRNSRLRVGQPRTGAAGIRRTTREIMQLPQAHQPTHAVPKLGIHPKLQPNPNAPAPASDKSIAAAIATSPKLAVGTSFTGATLAEEQIGAGGFVPPDSMGAVGPTQFLVGVNGKIKVLSKTGTVGQLNTDLNTFFSSVMTPPPAGGDTETTDPRVRYDTLSGKWFVTAIDVSFDSVGNVQGSNRFLIAVSDGPTITNTTVWTFFQFQGDTGTTGADLDNGALADFDTLGIDANALYMGANMFDPSGGFLSSSVFVIRKSSVTGAGPIVVTPFRDVVNTGTGDGPFTPQGADNDDPAATVGYYVGHDDQFFGRLDILRVGTRALPRHSPGLSRSTSRGRIQTRSRSAFPPAVRRDRSTAETSA